MRLICLMAVEVPSPVKQNDLSRAGHVSGRMLGRGMLALCLLACMIPDRGNTTDADASWLRLERLNTQQQRQLGTGQRQYSDGVQPLMPAEGRQLDRQFRQQKQEQQLLQDKQLRDRSLLRQRQRGEPESDRSNRQRLNLQRARQQQRNQQNRFRQQRRTWRSGR